MSKSINQKLSTQLTVTIGGFLLLFTIPLVYYLTNSERNNLLGQALIQGQSISRLTALAIVEPVLEEDYPVISHYAKTLITNNPNIVNITVLRPDGMIIINQSPSPEINISEKYLAEYDTEILLEAMDSLGRVRITFSNESIYLTINHRVRNIFGSIFLAIILLMGLLKFVLKRMVIRPLQTLSDGADIIATGQLGHRIEIESKNEYAQVARRFNRMAQKVQKTNQDIILALEEANEANRLKSQFLANMSHEIGTPLNAVVGFSQLLKKCELTDYQERYVDRINIASASLCELINNILDFSKIESGKLSLESTDFNLQNILSTIGVTQNDQAAEKGIEFIVSIDPELPTNLVGDPTRIKQIIVNLVSNAIKFTEKGYVRIDVSGNKIEDELQFTVSVTDTGIGMTEEQLGIVFNSFVQADGSTTRNYGGTGLGLSISKHLVKLMKGEISVNSRKGDGSVFYLRLRLPISDKDEWLDSEAIRYDLLSGLSILVVDDNNEVRAHLKHLLEFYSAKIALASNGYKAIDMIKQNPGTYELIILDWMMPEINGLMVADKLKQDPDVEDIPIIIASAFDDDELRANQTKNNIKAYIFKPLVVNQLIKTIAGIVNPEMEEQVDQDEPALIDTKNISNITLRKRCLIVDDNQFNRELASEFVRQLGLVANTADDGKQAIVELKRALKEDDAYDIVLMDMQMPITDGYQASAIIKETEELKDIIIIAITANALIGDREKCEQAGVDDYLPKPLDIKLLETRIHHWLSISATNQNTQTTHIATQNFAGLDIQAAICRMGGLEETYYLVLKSFCNDKQFLENILFPAIEGSDDETAQRITHSLKGVAGTIGANNLEAQANGIETSIKNGNRDSLDLTDLTAAYKETMISVIQYISKYEDKNVH